MPTPDNLANPLAVSPAPVVPASDTVGPEAVDFPVVLAEELREIDRLRLARQTAAPDPHKDPAPAKIEAPESLDKIFQDIAGRKQTAAKLRAERNAVDKLQHRKADAKEISPAESSVKTSRAAWYATTADITGRTFRAARERKLVGLALSGGGIRSATFSLGVLQGLANSGLLHKIDYLSTVSGGGYIGSWLEAWIYRAGNDKSGVVARCGANPADDAKLKPLQRVERCLQTSRTEKKDRAESQAIRFLRQYSNYLTPRLGLLGADTWTVVSIYLRNLLLNQAVLVLFVSLLLLFPYFAVWLALLFQRFMFRAALLTPLVAGVLVLIALGGIAYNMQHLTGQGPTGNYPASARQGAVVAWVIPPLLLAPLILGIAIASDRRHNFSVRVMKRGLALGIPWRNWPIWNHLILCWALVGAGFFAAAWFLSVVFGSGLRGMKGQWNSWKVLAESVAYAVLSGAVGGLLMRTFALEILTKRDTNDLWFVVSYGAPIITLIFMLVAALQLGLMGRLAPDVRREWWGRLGAWLMISIVLWLAIFTLAFYAPLGVMWAGGKVAAAGGIAWIVSTLTGIIGGKNDKTGVMNSQAAKEVALSVTPYVFILGLAVALATILEEVLANVTAFAIANSDAANAAKLADYIPTINAMFHKWGTTAAVGRPASQAVVTGVSPSYVGAHWQILGAIVGHANVLGWCGAVILAACLLLAWRVDLNEFSMNYFYRNRLVRCYLGASHKMRKPNPFTGFDPHDDVAVHEIRSARGYSGPFPLINTALNLVKGQNLAWQERKAESFAITPLRCGFDTSLERLDLKEETEHLQDKLAAFAYRPTDGYAYARCPEGGCHAAQAPCDAGQCKNTEACPGGTCVKAHCPTGTCKRGGFRLGTAVSISGAAASPNMGYHSVPSLALLMTFFNVRLGFWAGNPRNEKTWSKAAPVFGLQQLLAELFSLTNDEAPYVYLSDGGHFENLGLYELVKRRCEYIVVCDGDADGKYAFGDLGNAIRKCREDIGVDIEITVEKIGSPASANAAGDAGSKAGDSNGANAPAANGKAGFGQAHWAIGKIHYENVDKGAAPGTLIYLKTSLTGDEPADVLAYNRVHADFPHQSTGNQWFTESQFESYRALGEHIVENFLSQMKFSSANPDALFAEIEKHRPGA